jgi:hypothetical protein
VSYPCVKKRGKKHSSIQSANVSWAEWKQQKHRNWITSCTMHDELEKLKPSQNKKIHGKEVALLQAMPTLRKWLLPGVLENLWGLEIPHGSQIELKLLVCCTRHLKFEALDGVKKYACFFPQVPPWTLVALQRFPGMALAALEATQLVGSWFA